MKTGAGAILRALIGYALLAAMVSCSIPILEEQNCREARPAIREFYSFHFGNEMLFSAETLEARSGFLTPRLMNELGSNHGTGDVFTSGSDDVPRAFRAGSCVAAEGEAKFEVLLFWHNDNETRQRSISVTMQRVNDAWLVDRISREFNK